MSGHPCCSAGGRAGGVLLTPLRPRPAHVVSFGPVRYSMGKVEGGIGIGVSEFDELVVVILGTFNRRRVAIFHNIGRFTGGGTHCLKSFLRFCGALFSHVAKLLRGVYL